MNIIKNSFWNILGVAAPALIVIPSLGMLARNLGVDLFGLYSIIFIIVGYGGLIDAGISKSVIYFISNNRANSQKILEIISTASILIFIIALSIVFTVYISLDYILDSIIMSSHIAYEDVVFSIQMVLILIPFSILIVIYQGYIEGVENFYQLNMLRVFTTPLTTLIPALLTIYEPSLVFAVYGIIISKIISLLASVGYFYKDLGLKSYRIYFSKDVIKDIYRFGSWISISNIVSPIMNTFDRFFIASLQGVSAMGLYSAAADAIARLTIFPVAIARVIFPILCDQNQRDKHAGAINYSNRLLLASSVIITSSFIYFADVIIRVWFGPDFGSETVIAFQILLVGFFFNALAQTPFNIIQARGQSKIIALIHLTELVPYLIMMYFLVLNYSTLGAAAGWSLRVFFDYVLLKIIEARTDEI